MTQQTSADPTPNPLPPKRDILLSYGWNDFFEKQLSACSESQQKATEPGRVFIELRGVLQVVTANGTISARIPGRMHHQAHTGGELPTVGDWVLVLPPEREGEDGWIDHVFKRHSKFSRQAAGARTREQVVAANVDRFLVVMGIDGDFQPRRLERYTSSIREAGAEVSILLNKADLSDQLEDFRLRVQEASPNTPVHLISAKEGEGLDQLQAYLTPGTTLALVGSSGVGKSTLLNRLMGREVMKTKEVRGSDDRGQHTTSHRELLRLPGGALLIDNPGIREIQLWDSDDGIDETFTEITELAGQCRFTDCQHQDEPDCAVQAALAKGDISSSRLRSYRKLRAEQSTQSARKTQYGRSRAKGTTKMIHRALREKYKNRYK